MYIYIHTHTHTPHTHHTHTHTHTHTNTHMQGVAGAVADKGSLHSFLPHLHMCLRQALQDVGIKSLVNPNFAGFTSTKVQILLAFLVQKGKCRH